jgi:hypothetical protein
MATGGCCCLKIGVIDSKVKRSGGLRADYALQRPHMRVGVSLLFLVIVVRWKQDGRVDALKAIAQNRIPLL